MVLSLTNTAFGCLVVNINIKNMILKLNLTKASVCLFCLFGYCSKSNSQTFQITPYRNTPYNTSSIDISVFSRSLEIIQIQQNEANNEYEKLLLEIAKYRDALYDDIETLVWFKNYKENIENSFYFYMSQGYFNQARNYCITKRGDIAFDVELRSRIKTAREYREMLSSIQRRTDMTQEEKDKWVKENPYRFVPIYDENGHIIDGELGVDK